MSFKKLPHGFGLRSEFVVGVLACDESGPADAPAEEVYQGGVPTFFFRRGSTLQPCLQGAGPPRQKFEPLDLRQSSTRPSKQQKKSGLLHSGGNSTTARSREFDSDRLNWVGARRDQLRLLDPSQQPWLAVPSSTDISAATRRTDELCSVTWSPRSSGRRPSTRHGPRRRRPSGWPRSSSHWRRGTMRPPGEQRRASSLYVPSLVSPLSLSLRSHTLPLRDCGSLLAHPTSPYSQQ